MLFYVAFKPKRLLSHTISLKHTLYLLTYHCIIYIMIVVNKLKYGSMPESRLSGQGYRNSDKTTTEA